MTRHILPAELKRVRKSLFVRAHEYGKLLSGQIRQLPSPMPGPIESRKMENAGSYLYKELPVFRIHFFIDGDASACDILRSESV
jgi:hypothetical protein